jgi:hypothetical protein
MHSGTKVHEPVLCKCMQFTGQLGISLQDTARTGPQKLHQGDQFVADAVAQILRIAVARIHAERDAVFSCVRLDRLPRATEQRSDERTGAHRYAGPTVATHAPQEVHQQGLHRVVGVMGHGQQGGTLPHSAMEGLVTGRSGRHLQGTTFHRSVRRNINMLNPAWDPERCGRPLHQFPVGIAVAPTQSMVNMEYLQRVAERMEQMHQHHAVNTTAHGHPQRDAIRNPASMPQEASDSITHDGAHQ